MMLISKSFSVRVTVYEYFESLVIVVINHSRLCVCVCVYEWGR